MNYVWAITAVILITIEAATVQFVCIWFAAGSIAALTAQMLGAEFPVQCAVFVVVSVLLLIFTRPIVKKLMHGKEEKTNADSLIGKEIIIASDVDNIRNSGSAKVGGVDWSVKSADGDTIPAGEKVKIEAIEGVKLVVRKD